MSAAKLSSLTALCQCHIQPGSSQTPCRYLPRSAYLLRLLPGILEMLSEHGAEDKPSSETCIRQAISKWGFLFSQGSPSTWHRLPAHLRPSVTEHPGQIPLLAATPVRLGQSERGVPAAPQQCLCSAGCAPR